MTPAAHKRTRWVMVVVLLVALGAAVQGFRQSDRRNETIRSRHQQVQELHDVEREWLTWTSAVETFAARTPATSTPLRQMIEDTLGATSFNLSATETRPLTPPWELERSELFAAGLPAAQLARLLDAFDHRLPDCRVAELLVIPSESEPGRLRVTLVIDQITANRQDTGT